MSAHVPKPPTDTLTGAWLIERADPGETSTIQVGRGKQPKTLRTWALHVRHVATGATDQVRCRAALTTEYRAGQQVDGEIVRRWDGIWFQRSRPVVGPRRG